MLVSGAVPLLWLALFYLEVLLVRLHLGRWPSYGNPDPGYMPQPYFGLDVIVTLWFFLLPLFSLFAIVALGLSLLSLFRSLRVPALAFLAGVAVTFIIVTIDPGAFFEWLMD
jgi:hypothetical protein